MMRRLLTTIVTVVATVAMAQDRTAENFCLRPQTTSDVTMPFAVAAEGFRFQPTWGLDQAWINEQNLRKGVRHMGAENVGIGRTAFRLTKALTNDSILDADQTEKMRQRAAMFDIVDKELPLVFTADQEAGSDEYFVKNRSANTVHWAAGINSHVHWMQKYTMHPIVGISPFNEPDYWTQEEGATTAKQREVARLLKVQYPRCKDIAIVGGNTLNDDKAWEWYSSGKDYYDWGNTHQLAGSFANYANFFKRVTAEGKIGYADEMHNVGEAMVGLEYGMTVGIWWGFDSRARGEFCDISRHGERLAYAEHRDNWTAASVYRHDDGRVKAFIGSSERQAATTTYQLLSTDREVYYDGVGPLREYSVEIPGGTGYQQGQTNAECVVDVTWGEDVAPAVIDGTYRIFNKATENAIVAAGQSILMQKGSKAKAQQWTVKRCDTRIGGDFSFYDIVSVATANLHINVKDFSTLDGAEVIAYSRNATPTSNEQWYLQYAGNGYYYIRNRETALYLTAKSALKTSGVKIYTNELQDEEERDRQLWRLLPVDGSNVVDYEVEAPAAPAALTAQALPAAVRLEWMAADAADLDSYTVLRADRATGEWNTIARGVTATAYVDNTCRPGSIYIYKVKAVDKAQNRSADSQTAEAGPTGERALVARWQFDGDLLDATPHQMDAALSGSLQFVDDHQAGSQSLRVVAGYSTFVQLPYEVASSKELTFAAWVKVNSTVAWQRIFDFGRDTDHYLFLTATNGSVMRFAIKNGGNEQHVDCPSKLPVGQWRHVAVTIDDTRTAIYVDGQEVAAATDITITPADVAPVLNYLGRSQFTADPFLTGYYDDVRIYNYALTADEVQTVMDDVASGIHAVPGASASDAASDNGASPAAGSNSALYTLGGRRIAAEETVKGVVLTPEGRKVMKK